ncbi:hypothetical protein FKP32DRAFT_996537 [Trametes sanguinea]|nr:hypothetical protein FKP32DRAFT_996537 [Trametes sanguinea]
MPTSAFHDVPTCRGGRGRALLSSFGGRSYSSAASTQLISQGISTAYLWNALPGPNIPIPPSSTGPSLLNSSSRYALPASVILSASIHPRSEIDAALPKSAVCEVFSLTFFVHRSSPSAPQNYFSALLSNSTLTILPFSYHAFLPTAPRASHGKCPRQPHFLRWRE